jgi:hypothetical protein
MRAATPEELEQIRQNAIVCMADIYGLNPDKTAAEFYFYRSSRKSRFKYWNEEKELLDSIRSFYLSQERKLGVQDYIPPVEELLEIGNAAFLYANKRYRSSIKREKETAQNGDVFELFTSPEQYIYTFGENTVLFLTGRCGAGKSTLVKKLQQLLSKKSCWVRQDFSLEPLMCLCIPIWRTLLSHSHSSFHCVL